jgi:hypothetical protein
MENRKGSPMTPINQKKYLEAIEQTNAIFAFEGFQPTPGSRLIDTAVLAGRVTRNQVAKEMLEYATLHKNIEGFIESRSWAVALGL